MAEGSRWRDLAPASRMWPWRRAAAAMENIWIEGGVNETTEGREEREEREEWQRWMECCKKEEEGETLMSEGRKQRSKRGAEEAKGPRDKDSTR